MVICQICNCRFRAITGTHVSKHGLTLKEYISQYPGNILCDDIVNGKSSKMKVHARTNEKMKKGLRSAQAKMRRMRFYRLDEKFPQHHVSFKGMHFRAGAQNIDPDFQYTTQGFINFIRYLGPVPPFMITPTCGRKDHSKGYFKGNFEWQSKSENGQEGATRQWSARL